MPSTLSSGRVGILGGTLDPIHNGHLGAAQAARRALDLDHVLIMPARVPPHRQRGPAASAFHRFAMAALAASTLEHVAVSDADLSSDGPSYTALTLERLAHAGLNPARTFFITGADAFAEIETWYRYPGVLDLAHFIVISRPGRTAASVGAALPALQPRLRSPARERQASPPGIYLVDADTPDVSSTDLRRRLAAGAPVTGLVPDVVERHIAQHGLYVDTAVVEHLR